MSFAVSSLIRRLCPFFFFPKRCTNVRATSPFLITSLLFSLFLLRLWGSCTSSLMICSCKLSPSRRGSTSQRWSPRLSASTCPRSSPAWSSPSFSTIRPEKASRRVETPREGLWFHEVKWNTRSQWSHERHKAHSSKSNCIHFVILTACYLYYTRHVFPGVDLKNKKK